MNVYTLYVGDMKHTHNLNKTKGSGVINIGILLKKKTANNVYYSYIICITLTSIAFLL